MEKSLDRKLRALAADPRAREFIIADAKDADMAFGIGAAGRSPEAHAGETRFRTLREYRDVIREVVRQELVDIMLMSAGTSEVLTIHERVFDGSPVTPAARANDTTDVWVVRGGKYLADPAKPFRSASLDHIQCGKVVCKPEERRLGPDLGLYSVTFTNNTRDDLETLESYREFRHEAEAKGFRYFLEVFDPNVSGAVDPALAADFVNDMIARSLAGVVGAARPTFLKIVYHGPKAMEELCAYDPSLVVGILGGSAGTTYDAFKLIAEAQKYGARVALYGRKINNAENQFAFIRFLRLIVDGQISPEEAVRAYHGVLERLGVRPHRPFDEDSRLQTGVMSYGGSSTTISLPSADAPPAAAKPAHGACACQGRKTEEKKPLVTTSASSPSVPSPIDDHHHDDGHACACPTTVSKNDKTPTPKTEAPNFAAMNSAERLDYHRGRIGRLLGERRG
ncbi:MAG: hypothetical protein ACRDD1_05015 [Planctomycetia bacterium]